MIQAGAVAAMTALAGLSVATTARAESLYDALAAAYRDNPELNAERAKLRATDENLPQALAGWRPSVFAGADAAATHQESVIRGAGRSKSSLNPRGFSITISQNLFAGFRTVNSVKQAEAVVRAGREILHNVEQNVLFSAAEAYMNVVRDNAVVRLQRNNVEVLRQQLRAAQDRFSVGEVTRTDVAQAEASVALAASDLSAADAQLSSSRAVYQQIVGHLPNGVTQPKVVRNVLPRNLNEATAIADAQHPAIVASVYLEEAASHQVDITTGELLPTFDVEGSYGRRYDPSSSIDRSESAQIIGRLNVPIYQAGQTSSRVRQAKQTKSQRRLEVDLSRRQVRAAVISAWGQYDAAKAQIRSAQARIEANRIALNGVQEEAKVGQRTVLDVLNAQQDLLNAQVAFATAQRDEVVAAYALISAVGKLQAGKLNLPVKLYDPMANYAAVRNKWFGLSVSE